MFVHIQSGLTKKFKREVYRVFNCEKSTHGLVETLSKLIGMGNSFKKKYTR
jgi:hypothetical protein